LEESRFHGAETKGVTKVRLQGQVAVITGGGQGLGRRFAHRFAAEGAAVVVVDINEPKAQAVASEIQAQGGRAVALAADVGDEAQVARMVQEALAAFGRLDILVNNAAIFSTLKLRPFEEIPLDEWQKVLAVNVTGVFLCCRAAVPAMRRQGRGKIVNISSAAVRMGRPLYLHYVTSKSALVGFTRALAREVGDYGITVNCVMPGATVTEIPRETVSRESLEAMVTARAIKRQQVPEDVEGAVLFFASPDSDFITGQTLVVDGGLVMR